MNRLITECGMRTSFENTKGGKLLSNHSLILYSNRSSNLFLWGEPIINIQSMSWTKRKFPKTFGYEVLDVLEVSAGNLTRYFTTDRNAEIDKELILKLIERVQSQAVEATAGETTLRIPNALYLGGLPDDQAPSTARTHLNLNSRGIWVSQVRGLCEWRSCSGVAIDGGEVSKRKIGATLAFGALGALAAKGSKERTYLTVKNVDGSSAYFEVDKATPTIVRATVAPLLHQVGIRFVDESVGAPTLHSTQEVDVDSLARGLCELASLRDDGLLTPDEFEEQKSRILRSGDNGGN